MYEILCGDWPQMYTQILYKIISFLTKIWKNMNNVRKFVIYLEYEIVKM
jgi:hypothetical protein